MVIIVALNWERGVFITETLIWVFGTISPANGGVVTVENVRDQAGRRPEQGSRDGSLVEPITLTITLRHVGICLNGIKLMHQGTRIHTV